MARSDMQSLWKAWTDWHSNDLQPPGFTCLPANQAGILKIGFGAKAGGGGGGHLILTHQRRSLGQTVETTWHEQT